LEATFEKHDILEVLLVYQVGYFLKNWCQCIHHNEETQCWLDESLANVEFAALNLYAQLPMTEVFEQLEASGYVQYHLYVRQLALLIIELTVQDEKLGWSYHDFKGVFVQSKKICLSSLEKEARAVVLTLKLATLYAPLVEHLYVDFIDVAMKFIKSVHLVDKKVYLRVLCSYVRCIKQIFDSFTPVLRVCVLDGLFFFNFIGCFRGTDTVVVEKSKSAKFHSELLDDVKQLNFGVVPLVEVVSEEQVDLQAVRAHSDKFFLWLQNS